MPSTRNCKRLRASLPAALFSLVLLDGAILSLHGVGQVVTAREPRAAEPAKRSEPGALARDVNGPTISPAHSAMKHGGIVSYAEPKESLVYRIAAERAGPGASPAEVEQAARSYLADWHQTAYHGPGPDAELRLRNHELALLSPAATTTTGGIRPAARPAQGVSGTLRLLAVAVEFAGTDTANDFSHPVADAAVGCITDTVTATGPLHNQIPAPGPRDNMSSWRASFERDYYERMVFSTEGVTERMRPDLTDPEDGLPGIDISGQTMRNYFAEVSGGRVSFDGGPKGIIPWVGLPHSEAYYAAAACRDGQVPAAQNMSGMPQNPEFGDGVEQLLKDMVDILNAREPDFPWSDYDTDHDGIIDHVVIFHAGKDKSAGGGQQGYQAIWAHRGDVDVADGGYVTDDHGTPGNPDDDIRLLGYTMQYEDVEPGVLTHEFGHDLGLPDLYDGGSGGTSDVSFWDLMAYGANTGKLLGTNPPHMSAWSKMMLGWADPVVITPTDQPSLLFLGQTSHPPAGTTQAARINLPANMVTYTQLVTGSTQAWWSNNDQNWADVRLGRSVDLTNVVGPVSFTFGMNYVIEQDWDYLFVEVSVDGGQTFTQTQGVDVGTGEELTTPGDYSDPNGRLGDFGDLRYGYTGDSGGWLQVAHDLTPYAGQAIQLRLRYATDAGFLERGAFADNFRILAGSTVLLDDPVENNDPHGWTATVATFIRGEPLGAGWVFSNGTETFPQYYLLEWRNDDGFDQGLRYGYNAVFSGLTPSGGDEFLADKVAAVTPGMLVWLRDLRFGGGFDGGNSVLSAANLLSAPSEGSKGGLLLVDANPQPLRGPRAGTISTQYGTWPFPPRNNWGGNTQAIDASFGKLPGQPFTLTVATGTTNPATTIMTPTLYLAAAPVPAFHDALGYYPGVETLPEPVTTFSDTVRLRRKPYTLVDPDASVVVPTRGYYPPRTPAGFTGHGAETSPPSLDVSQFETIYQTVDGNVSMSVGQANGENVVGQQSGNPGDYDVQLGYHFEVADQAPDGSTGMVRVWNRSEAAWLASQLTVASAAEPIRVDTRLRNVGGAGTLTAYAAFAAAALTFVDGDAGLVPVASSAAAVVAAVNSGGRTALEALAVTPDKATALVWSGPLASGTEATFAYRLAVRAGTSSAAIVTSTYGSSPDVVLATDRLTYGRVYLPITYQP